MISKLVCLQAAMGILYFFLQYIVLHVAAHRSNWTKSRICSHDGRDGQGQRHSFISFACNASGHGDVFRDHPESDGRGGYLDSSSSKDFEREIMNYNQQVLGKTGSWRCWLHLWQRDSVLHEFQLSQREGRQVSWQRHVAPQESLGFSNYLYPSYDVVDRSAGHPHRMCCGNSASVWNLDSCWIDTSDYSESACCFQDTLPPLRCDSRAGLIFARRHSSSTADCPSVSDLATVFRQLDTFVGFEAYVRLYEQFLPSIDAPARVLLFGIASGTLISMLGNWFPDGFVFGMSDARQLAIFAEAHWPDLVVRGANASGNVFLLDSAPGGQWHIRAAQGVFDLIVDDFGWHGQIDRFEKVFPLQVAPGGYFVAQNISEVSLRYFKKLAASVRTVALAARGIRRTGAESFQAFSGLGALTNIQISFHSGIVVVRKVASQKSVSLHQYRNPLDGVISSNLQISSQRQLWLLTCETRSGSRDLFHWMLGARNLRDDAAMSREVNVHVANVCESFKGKYSNMDKSRELIKFMDRSLGSGSMRLEDVIIFSDTDVFLNSWLLDATDVLQRFDTARGDKMFLAGVQPGCFVGRACTKDEINRFFPDATRSNCGQFINAGVWSGIIKQVLLILRDIMTAESELPQDYLSEQGIFTYVLMGDKYRDAVALDSNGDLMRTWKWGAIDASRSGEWEMCGDGKKCDLDDWGHRGMWGVQSLQNENHSNQNRRIGIQLVKPPDRLVEEECVGNPAPFILHYNGWNGKLHLHKLMNDFLSSLHDL